MAKKSTCPWCGGDTPPKVVKKENNFGSVIERRCEACDKVLAAYLEDEGQFFERIRTY